MALRSVNPATGIVLSETPELTDAELEAKLLKADAAFHEWKRVTFSERAKLMRAAATELRTGREALALCMTQEVGKTRNASLGEIEKCATVCEYYADHAEQFLSPESVTTDAPESFVRFDPLGVVLAVMPWNFPLWQVFRFAAPALMAGNVGVLKHASNVQGCARAIEEVFVKAGFPDGVFQNLAIGSPRVAPLIADDRVHAVTLTGSEAAGVSVASASGKALKKVVLELGGSDPFIVLEDADLVRAAQVAVLTRMQANAGQSCIAAKRFIVDKRRVEEFTTLLVKEVTALRVGDPTVDSTDVGPLANEQMVLDLERQVSASVALGAVVRVGGARLDGAGFFYPPTVLSNSTKGMPVCDEEVFGPVFPIIAVSGDEEAIRVANDSRYGLGATIFSRDTEKAKKYAAAIESGCVYINSQVRSDARLPFGGIKKSGYGRELSHYGIREFVNIKTVSVCP